MSGSRPGEEQEDRSKDWGKPCGEGAEDWWGSRWRNDRVDTIGWGASFIWAALVVLASVTGFAANFRWWDGWAVFFVGAGIITLVEAVIRLQVPRYRNKCVATLVWGLFMLAIGFGAGDWVAGGWFWVLALAIIGILIIRGALARRV